MASTGKLEKMLILGFEDNKKAESGGPANAREKIQVLINPESYSLDYKVKYAESGQGQGTSGKQQKFERIEPEEISFEFLFDSSGVIDGKPRQDGIADEVKKFRDLLIGYKGDSHKPMCLKLAWGANDIFVGVATEMNITYKLFSADGKPLRAVVKAKFKKSTEEEKRTAREDRRSPDLTHIRTVKAGDTLPLMCHRIYGHSKYYLQVAKENGITNFRQLAPGTVLAFPPIAPKEPTT
jgi:phage tail protein X